MKKLFLTAFTSAFLLTACGDSTSAPNTANSSESREPESSSSIVPESSSSILTDSSFIKQIFVENDSAQAVLEAQIRVEKAIMFTDTLSDPRDCVNLGEAIQDPTENEILGCERRVCSLHPEIKWENQELMELCNSLY